MNRVSARSGYALMLVLIAIVALLLFYGVAYRHLACALRLESARVQQQQRDEGTIHALARALTLLETGLPPSQPYVCGVTVTTATGPRLFTVTLSHEGVENWSVHAAPALPGADPDPMPSSFAP
jgi:hypothetical protein